MVSFMSEEENAESTGAEGDAKAVEELSPEEQLARYEEAMKNDDWGHQPC